MLGLDETFDVDAHHALAREAAGQSVVLLENDGILPLAANAGVAVVGELARTPRFQGAGSSQVNPTRVDVILDELRAVYGEVPFAAGYGIGDTAADDTLKAEAVEVARRAAADGGTVVVVLGLPPADESEGYDRTHMELPASQRSLLAAVAEANPKVVVVLANGSTVLLGEVVPHARALVEAWLGGQAAGGGIVDVLTGAVNPSGKLAETIPHRIEDAASFLNFPGDTSVVRYGEGLFIGYRDFDRTRTEVAYPFGFGRSYTTFELSDLDVTTTGSVADATLAATIQVSVTNTGQRAGAEVVQVYVADPEASVTRPVRELKGFAKVHLEAGESRRVRVELDQRAFAFWSIRTHRWTVEAGTFVVEVGTSSRDLPVRQAVAVEAPSTAAPLTRDSTLQEWLADPRGRDLVDRELASSGLTLDPELVEVVGNAPMSTLASFGALSLDHDALDRVAQEWRADIPTSTEQEASHP